MEEIGIEIKYCFSSSHRGQSHRGGVLVPSSSMYYEVRVFGAFAGHFLIVGCVNCNNVLVWDFRFF